MATSRKTVHIGSWMRGARAYSRLPQKTIAIEMGVQESHVTRKLEEEELDPDFVADFFMALGRLQVKRDAIFANR